MSRANLTHPPMGWNSFDAFGWSVNEQEVLANAEFVDKHLKPFGYEYITVDYCWAHPGFDDRDNPNFDENLRPELHFDKYGRLLPSYDRFPSSIWTGGFHELSDKIHGMGLKFAIHIMRGIPRQAVEMKTVIKGTNITADQIAMTDPEDNCTWLRHMYGIDMTKNGAQEYLNSLFELYADWGVDLIKIDDILFPYTEGRRREIDGYRKAIDSCGRDIIMSLSPGDADLSDAEHLDKQADMWRISADFWDRWSDIVRLNKLFVGWCNADVKHGYPDGDMVPFSRLSLRGPMEKPRYSRFTHDEKRTLMSLWSVNGSPLILGGDLTAIDDDALEALTNPDVISVDQHSKSSKLVCDDNGLQCWAAEDNTCDKIKYVAVVNMSDSIRTFKLSDFGAIEGECDYLRELWSGRNYCPDCTEVIREHQSMLFRIVSK